MSSFCEDTVQPCTVIIESLGRQVNSQTWAHSNSQRLDILFQKGYCIYLPSSLSGDEKLNEIFMENTCALQGSIHICQMLLL